MAAIASMPAITLSDAAMQLCVSYRYACRLDGQAGLGGLDELTRQIHRIVISALPVLLQAAGIDLTAMRLEGDFPRMKDLCFAGGAGPTSAIQPKAA